MFIVPFISNHLYDPETDAESAFIIGSCFIVELLLFLLVYCSFKKDEIEALGKEVSYSTKTIRFILSSYDSSNSLLFFCISCKARNIILVNNTVIVQSYL